MITRHLWKAISVSFFLSSFASADSAGRCGHMRWPVKTGTDRDSAFIHLNTVIPITLEQMIAWPAPAQLPQDARIKPQEISLFTVTATLVETFFSEDSDYHLLLQGASGKTMATEIPDPLCVGAQSPLLKWIKSARAQVDARLKMLPTAQKVSIPVKVIGIGFFDTPHAPGAATNGIELHPILDIQFDSRKVSVSEASI